MKKPFAWSYSALTGFETCPLQYHQMRILKAWPDPPGEGQLWGQEVHKLIENRIAMGKALPAYLANVETIVQKLENSKGVVLPEYKMALNVSLQPVDYFAKDVWLRAIGDVVKIHGDKCFQLDWKTGKYRPSTEQMELQSAVALATYPHLTEVANVYHFVKERRNITTKVTREDVPVIWQKFLPRVKKMEAAIAAGEFPANPTGLCKAYCNVLSCEHNGKRTT